jgi:hypothetical protein
METYSIFNFKLIPFFLNQPNFFIITLRLIKVNALVEQNGLQAAMS